MCKIVERVTFDTVPKLNRKRVAAYARVSTGKDAMMHSLAAQISYYSNMIQQNPEWEYCGVYADEAVSGTKDSRKNFQRLLADCRTGRIDIVITKSISRFARNTVTLLEAVRELREIGVDVFFEEQRIHTASSEGELLLTLLSSFAQAESYSNSENMKWSYRRRFSEGKTTAVTILFGYDVKKNQLTVNEEQARIVREIFSRFISGETMTSIARSLNERNVTGVLGGKMTQQRIREILENEKYTGDALLQKSFVRSHLDRKETKNRGELPKYYIEGDHDAIIDKETFERVQELRKAMYESLSFRKKAQETAFTGMIRCAKCGNNYHSAFNHRKIWQCSTYRTQGCSACNSKAIPDEILKRLCCEVLGLEEFDDDLFISRVTSLEANNDSEGNILTFHLTDGTETVKRWKHPSRRDSWTEEMKAGAAEKAKERAAKRNGKC